MTFISHKSHFVSVPRHVGSKNDTNPWEECNRKSTHAGFCVGNDKLARAPVELIWDGKVVHSGHVSGLDDL